MSEEAKQISAPKPEAKDFLPDVNSAGKQLVFWSAIVIFYILGDLQLNLVGEEGSKGLQTPWGVPVSNVSNAKFLIGLKMIHGYFVVRFFILSYGFLVATIIERRRHDSERVLQELIFHMEGGPTYPRSREESEKEGLEWKILRYDRFSYFISLLFLSFVPIILPFLVGLFAITLLW